MSISDKIREAREWGRCVDTLKLSVDSMYEICRIQQNILGCEEAIMFLKHAIRDFHCLIDTIKIEQNWENSEERPMTSIAWEIRGTVSRNSILQKNDKNCQTQQPVKKEDQQPIPKAVTEIDDSVAAVTKIKEDAEEWQVVQRRKSSVSNLLTKPQIQGKWTSIPFGRPSMGSVKAPKSAMDLPQTKSSMAKMAYSRQLLFEKQRKILLEKFNRRKKQHHQQQSEQQTKQSTQLNTKKNNAENNASFVAVVDHSHQKAASVEKDVPVENKIANKRQSSEPPHSLKLLIDQLSDDCEWRAMTEEEESLAQEEASLKKEIEIEEEENCLPTEDKTFDTEMDGINLKDEIDDVKTLEMDSFGIGNNDKQPSSAALMTKSSNATSHYRNPGEIAQLRAKLLSPTKRRKVDELVDSENKLRRAEELRSALQNNRARRLKILHQRVEEVCKKREEIQQRKLVHLEIVKERIQKAEENRLKGLEEIIQRGKDDELKIMEINLLNSFEAANQKLGKRYTQIRERNRLEKLVRKVEEERKRKNEENKQQMFAVEQRRKDAEEQRVQRLKNEADQQQQRQSHALTHRAKIMEKYRMKIALHSHKVNQRKARELEEKQQLLNKIQQKQDKYIENYEQCKEQVRQRAIELSSPRPSHVWIQCLTDFNLPLSDLTLYLNMQQQQQKQQASSSAHKSMQFLTCMRCKTKLFSDLHLVSHVLSQQHLKHVKVAHDENNMRNLNDEFLKTELSKIISLTDDNDAIAMELLAKSASNSMGMEDSSLTGSQSSSVVELLSTSIVSSTTETTTEMIAPPTKFTNIKQIIQRNVELFLSDAKFKSLLLENTTGVNKSQSAAKTAEPAGIKKKRTKLKQRFAREFEFIDAQMSSLHKKQHFSSLPKSNAIPKDLRRILINTLMPLLNEVAAKSVEKLVYNNDIQPIEKAILELTKCVKNSTEEFIQKTCQLLLSDMDLFGQLFVVCIRISKLVTATKNSGKSNNVVESNNPKICGNNGHCNLSRFNQKSLCLLLNVINHSNRINNNNKWYLSGKALKALCELFQLNLQKIFTAETTPSASSTRLEATHSALLILHILTQFILNNAEHSRTIGMLFSYLCTNCFLTEFILHCGKLDTSELCLASVELLTNSDGADAGQRMSIAPTSITSVNQLSICEVVTNFIFALFHGTVNGKAITTTMDNSSNDVEKKTVEKRESADDLVVECEDGGPSEDGNSVKTAQNQSRSSSATISRTQQIVAFGHKVSDSSWQHRDKLEIARTYSLWLYLICLHVYSQFGRFNSTICLATNNDHSNLGSTCLNNNKEKQQQMFANNRLPIILWKCMLLLFNKLSLVDTEINYKENIIRTFFHLECDKMVATRMASVLRLILHLVGKQQTADTALINLSTVEQEYLLRECIVSIGHFVRIESRNQLLCVLGWQRSILYSLCNLPLEYVHTEPLKHYLLPTICTIIWNCPTALETIRGEFCLHYLTDYLENAIQSINTGDDAAVYAFLATLIEQTRWAEVQKSIAEFCSTNSSTLLI